MLLWLQQATMNETPTLQLGIPEVKADLNRKLGLGIKRHKT